MRRSAAVGALDGRPASTPRRRRPASAPRARCAPSSPSCCPAATSTRSGTVHRDGVDAAGHGPRRAGPAARRPGPGEPGVPHGRAAGPGRHPARHDRPTCTPGSSRTCSPPTWRSCRTCTGGSTSEGHTRAGGDLPGLRARVRGRRRRWAPGGIVTYATDRLLRGGRVRRLPLPLVARRHPRPRARGPAPLRRGDQQVERPRTAGEVTGDGPVVLAARMRVGGSVARGRRVRSGTVRAGPFS